MNASTRHGVPQRFIHGDKRGGHVVPVGIEMGLPQKDGTSHLSRMRGGSHTYERAFPGMIRPQNHVVSERASGVPLARSAWGREKNTRTAGLRGGQTSLRLSQTPHALMHPKEHSVWLAHHGSSMGPPPRSFVSPVQNHSNNAAFARMGIVGIHQNSLSPSVATNAIASRASSSVTRLQQTEKRRQMQHSVMFRYTPTPPMDPSLYEVLVPMSLAKH